MDLQPSPEELAFRAEVRAFVQSHLPHDIRDRILGLYRIEREDYVRWQRILHQRGWGAPGWPVEYGGTGWGASQRLIFEEECYIAGAPRQVPFGLSMVGPVIQAFGSAEQKAHFLPRILTSEIWWCQGYSEPGAGSDLASLKTSAARRGAVYVVNGQKTWTTMAQWADWIFCLVRTLTEGRRQEGISFLLIDMKSPGITVRPIKTLDGSCDVNEVFFDDVEVPVANLVGEENKGWTYAKFLLGHERTTIGGIGPCRRLLQCAKRIAAQEMRRGKALIDDPYFRDRIVKIEMELIAHEWSLLRMVAAEQQNRAHGPEASALKIRASEIQGEIALVLMDSVGPYALPYDVATLELGYDGPRAGPAYANPLSGVYFDMRKVQIYGGTTEVQKNIIARALVGL